MTVRDLHGHGPRTPADLLDEAAAWCRAHDVTFDVYGTGPLLADFEAKVARLLGYEAARFMPSGVMAQTIALRVHADAAGRPHVGFHPTSHLEVHEQRAYDHIHGLHATLVGPADRPMLAEDLERLVEPLACVLTELPAREIGGQLPTWDELEALKAAAAARGVPLHLDGARLWGCATAYGRPLHEVTRGFASCYVSFYKDVGALSGAMLLGTEAFIAQAALWQRRQGGTLWSQAPSVASAAARLDGALEAIPTYIAHASALAKGLSALEGVELLPTLPRTNMFHVVAEGTPEQAISARDHVAEALGIRPFRAPRAGPLPGTWRTEMSIGASGVRIPVDEAVSAWSKAMAHIRTTGG